MLEDKSIDAVSVATTNMTHSLFGIWAMQAGKHVYVEKPCSHNIFEGRKLVEAARKYNKICQHGTQSRSSKGLKEAMAFLHAGKLGKVKIARGLCYKKRGSIGKKPDGTPPPSVDYDLWLGPAPSRAFNPNRFHYNWHWFWDYGNGDLGNQGVHEMDRARWGLGKATLPTRVVALGGRFGYEDDGETPNTLVAWFDYGDAELIFEVRGLETDDYLKGRVASIFHCENGTMVNPSYSGATAFDKDGKKIQDFGGGGDHFRNFVDAVKSGKRTDLNAEIEEGHLSAALCHLGNIPYRLGEMKPMGDKPFGDIASANETYDRMKAHLAANKVDTAAVKMRLGPMLTFDPKAEKFTGAQAEAANKLVTREYRKPFVVPDAV
jgi:predicted dehydrogenase